MTMRKLTLQIELNETIKEAQRSAFEHITSWELLETLKTEWEEGVVIVLIDIILKEDVSIHDLEYIGDFEILSVLKSEGNKHTCLARHQEPDISKDMFKEFDLDLINTTPTKLSEDKYTCSVIGDNENLTKFVELMKTTMGKVENMTFKKAAYQKHDILSVLTDKQREIIIAAQKYGYYSYPKEIRSEELAKKIGISKNTTIEHLRKAEERIMKNIVAGH
jgi:DNA-binding XRE family transcriptional regulator